jgi:hypothetical protein
MLGRGRPNSSKTLIVAVSRLSRRAESLDLSGGSMSLGESVGLTVVASAGGASASGAAGTADADTGAGSDVSAFIGVGGASSGDGAGFVTVLLVVSDAASSGWLAEALLKLGI